MCSSEIGPARRTRQFVRRAVDDRRGGAVAAPTVDHVGDTLPEHGGNRRRVDGCRLAVEVGAGHRERSQAAGEGPHERVVGAAHPDRRPVASELEPGALAPAQDHRERTRPEPLEHTGDLRAGRLDERLGLRERVDEDRQGHVAPVAP